MSDLLDAYDTLAAVTDRLAAVAVAAPIVGLNIDGSDAREKALIELRDLAEEGMDNVRRARDHLWDLVQELVAKAADEPEAACDHRPAETG
ncbi:MAG: hypothetical protein KDA49_09795 [Rhodospirillaceae bacterium]|nr:hypothetical protein [Rhodospirillaceae bacterium]